MFVGVGAPGCATCSPTPAKRPRPSFSSTSSTPSAAAAGPALLGGNDEREQTLNQLLAEMDGFDPATGVVVMAATNRPESLDPALLRPGRFDRTVEVPLPNQAERQAILAEHTSGKPLAADVDLDVVARGTPGFAGADLANLANEAAIVAVRHDRGMVTAADFQAARDRILSGGATRPTPCSRAKSTPSPSTRPATAWWPLFASTPTRWPRSPSCPRARLSA